eukprot:NODE_1684_length_1250_cov_68.676759_g1669_i0.p1 GENE.NODE_1684_length_1250_cov_68.676759_g1669_i0~~NODE_1684_length_1250_cov_68.676759_g1669_i0.p1  ORF type:complete len:352 (-),score=62.05 NODE_1684_length_1250_cov_68.676759_g1669_i0:152-1207(-)
MYTSPVAKRATAKVHNTPPRVPSGGSMAPPSTPPSTRKTTGFITSSPRHTPGKRLPQTSMSISTSSRLHRTASGSMFSPTFKPQRPEASSSTPFSPTMRPSPKKTWTSPLREELEHVIAMHGHEDPHMDEYNEDEFDPFRFIASLPPLLCDRIVKTALPPKTKCAPKVTLVLDLDETLVHCTTDNSGGLADFQFDVDFNNILYKVNCKKRPGMAAFLEHVHDLFEVVIFTASQSVYANKLLDIIDPENKWIKHRLFRDSCLGMEGNYLKDLTVLNRDPASVCIIDNSPQAFGYQVDNGIPILSYFEGHDDKELYKLVPFLEELSMADDVRPLIRQKFNLSERVGSKMCIAA